MNTTATFMESPASTGTLHITDKNSRTLCGEANTEMGGQPVSGVDPRSQRVCWTCAQLNQTSGQRSLLPDWMRQKHMTECLDEAIRIVHTNGVLEGAPHDRVEQTLVRVLQYQGMPPADYTNGLVPPSVEPSDEDLASVES